jgi:predicted NBD/HSP70 family sugar kinase
MNTHCTIQGKFIKLRHELDSTKPFSRRRLAAKVINIVNLEGATSLCVIPSSALAAAKESLEDLDRCGRWRQWVETTLGRKLTLVSTTRDTQSLRSNPMNITLSGSHKGTSAVSVGINIGGYYGRSVCIDAHGRVSFGPERRLINGNSISFEAITPERFCQELASWIRHEFTNYRYVGVAWAAPRGDSGVKPQLQHLFQSNSLLKAALKTGGVKQLLSEILRCPVSFWNDGEATAVADWFALHEPRSLSLSLKIGTSVACGAVVNSSLCTLPFEIAKCVIPWGSEVRRTDTVHPGICIEGTLREGVGAGSVAARYFGTTQAAHRFPDFQRRALEGDTAALRQVNYMAVALSESHYLLRECLGEFRFILGGKSMEGQFGRLLMTKLLENLRDHEICHSESRSDALITPWPATYSAAIGAALLARSVEPNGEVDMAVSPTEG